MKSLERALLQYYLGLDEAYRAWNSAASALHRSGTVGVTKLVDSGIGGSPRAEVLTCPC